MPRPRPSSPARTHAMRALPFTLAGAIVFALAITTAILMILAPRAAHAIQPHDAVRPDLVVPRPPAPATTATAAENTRLAAAPVWRGFVHAAGLDWQAEFNPTNGAPHRARGRAIAPEIAAAGVTSATSPVPAPIASDADAEARAREFIAAHASLLAADGVELALVKNVDRAGRRILIFQQMVNGVPVEGGRLDIRMTADGRVSLFGSDLLPGVNLATTPLLSAFDAAARVRAPIGFDPARDEERGVTLRILPVARPSGPEYRLAWRTEHFMRETPALWVTWLDGATGETLWRYDDLHYAAMSGTVDGDIQIVLPDDPYTSRSLEQLIVNVTGQGADTTDGAGAWSVTVPSAGSYEVTAGLRGSHLDVNNQAGADASFQGTFASGSPLTIHWSDTNSQPDERDAYFHANVAHDSIRAWDPSLTAVDYMMPCAVSLNDVCNAFWDGVGVNFFAAGGGCVNTGQMPDVVYHEYGHGITQFTYDPASCPGDQHEGFSDFYACTILDVPDVGRGFFGPGTRLRTLDNTLHYPEDLSGEVHHDGLIVGGALWHMRQRFIGSIGNHAIAVHLADSLFHYARYGEGQSFYDYFLDLASEDDNDGDLGNGTPHGIDIFAAFGQHGIGPGLYVAIAHDSLKDSESPLTPFAVDASITSVLPLDPDSLRLYYRMQPASGSPWSAWTSSVLLPSGPPHAYRGTIPGQPEGTSVQYYLTATSDTLGVRTVFPASAPSAPYNFFVGADHVPPVIVHAPIPDLTPADWPAAVNAVVTDNTALASVVVQSRRNGVDQPSFALTRGAGDQWTGTFPAGAAAGDVYEYRIVATDASAAANTVSAPYSGWSRIFIGASVTVFTDGIESGAPGWTHYIAAGGYVDQWNISTNRNHTPGGSHSWKFGGSTVFSHYQNFACGALQSPALSLGDHSRLSFWHWIRAEEGGPTTAYDGGVLEMTRDGGTTWEEVNPGTGGYDYTIISNPDSPFPGGTPCWSGSHDWRQVTVDLAGVTGTVSFRWRFGSDGGTTDLGWHVDDVLLTAVSARTGVEETQPVALAPSFALDANRPNPFALDTAIRFALPAAGRLDLAVFDVNGRRVRTLMSGEIAPGEHQVHWDARDQSGARVAPGVYFYRVTTEGFTATRKMTLTR